MMSEKRFNIATFPVSKRQGKTFRLMKEWENLVCRGCGEKMVLEKENDYESVKFCPNCGRRDLLVKKLKCEEIE
jgi:rRNA maturation endonuclease Nob1